MVGPVACGKTQLIQWATHHAQVTRVISGDDVAHVYSGTTDCDILEHLRVMAASARCRTLLFLDDLLTYPTPIVDAVEALFSEALGSNPNLIVVATIDTDVYWRTPRVRKWKSTCIRMYTPSFHDVARVWGAHAARFGNGDLRQSWLCRTNPNLSLIHI